VDSLLWYNAGKEDWSLVGGQLSDRRLGCQKTPFFGECCCPACGPRWPFRQSCASALPLPRKGDRPVAPTVTGSVFMQQTAQSKNGQGTLANVDTLDEVCTYRPCEIMAIFILSKISS